jgi:hypothetical protein
MNEDFLKYILSFHSNDKNIMKVNDSSSYMLLELNLNYLFIYLLFKKMGLSYYL